MNIREILTENGYNTHNISNKILEFDTGICTEIRDIPNTHCKLFDGVEIYDADEMKIITLNFEYGENEFLPMDVSYIGKDGYISVEVYYNEDCEVEFINDVR